MSDWLPALRHEAGHGSDSAHARFATAKGIGFRQCGGLRSAVDWRHACDLRAARYYPAGVVQWIACKSCDSAELHNLEVAGKADGFADGDAGVVRRVLPSSDGWTKVAAT